MKSRVKKGKKDRSMGRKTGRLFQQNPFSLNNYLLPIGDSPTTSQPTYEEHSLYLQMRSTQKSVSGLFLSNFVVIVLTVPTPALHHQSPASDPHRYSYAHSHFPYFPVDPSCQMRIGPARPNC